MSNTAEVVHYDYYIVKDAKVLAYKKKGENPVINDAAAAIEALIEAQRHQLHILPKSADATLHKMD